MKNNPSLSHGLLLLLSIATMTCNSEPGNNKTTSWTTYGQIQANDPEITRRYQRGNDNISTQIIVLNNAFHDNGILPYTKLRPTKKSDNTINITSTAGEYEPASFVIQSGNLKLQNVEIVVSDLTNNDKSSIISSSSIDLRIVKAWFQSAEAMRRTDRDAPKRLVPELLLHDNELVKVDFNKQTNSIQTKPYIQDTKELQFFSIPAHTNQQIWLTVSTPSNAAPGYYNGTLTINTNAINNEAFTKTIKITLRVLPFKLQDTHMLMGKFYLARLVKPNKIHHNSRGKNEEQMEHELIDMRNHGVNIMTLDHYFDSKTNISINTDSLAKQIRLIKQTKNTINPIVYVDWRVTGHNDEEYYKNKLRHINDTFSEEGIKDFWIYNRDEKKLSILKSSLHTFRAAHNIDSKNIVALQPNNAKALKGFLDYALIQHSTSKSAIRKLKAAGITPLAYGLPHAGEEKPATTRKTYGFNLISKEFSGSISYAYQSGQCWDDWMKWEKSNYRPNVMAYPTISKPIPTLQWEAWREGVDDLKYLATYAKLSGKSPVQALNDAASRNIISPEAIRSYLIEQTLDLSRQ